jgi:hypothetical protein
MVCWYSRMPGAQVHPFMVGRCARAPSRPSIAARTAPWPSLRLHSARSAPRAVELLAVLPACVGACRNVTPSASLAWLHPVFSPPQGTVAAEQLHGGFRMSKSASEIQTLMCTRSEPLPAAPSRLSRPISSAQVRRAQTARLCPPRASIHTLSSVSSGSAAR